VFNMPLTYCGNTGESPKIQSNAVDHCLGSIVEGTSGLDRDNC
jgi:hypothetical protein